MTPAASAFAPHRSLAIVRRLPERDGAEHTGGTESGDKQFPDRGSRSEELPRNSNRIRQRPAYPASPALFPWPPDRRVKPADGG
jgi:hypothetical protein